MKSYLISISITVPVKAKNLESAIDKVSKKYDRYDPIITETFDSDGNFINE